MNSPTHGYVGTPMVSKTKRTMQKLTALVLNKMSKPISKKGKPSRKSRQRNRGVALSGSAGESAGVYRELPVARQYVDFNMNQFIVKPIRHPVYGDGICVCGTEALANVVTAAAAADFFTNSVGTTSVNDIQLSPDSFNGKLALQARNYTRYRFPQLRLHFVPALGTSNPGLGAIGYTPDAVQSAFATQNFASTTQMEPNMTFSLNFPVSMEMIKGFHVDPELYYVELDNATNAGSRQTVQGQIVGFPSSNTLGVLTQGLLVAQYTCELYYPSTDYGFTFTARSLEEKRGVRALLNKMRGSSEDEEDEDDISIVSRRKVRGSSR